MARWEREWTRPSLLTPRPPPLGYRLPRPHARPQFDTQVLFSTGDFGNRFTINENVNGVTEDLGEERSVMSEAIVTSNDSVELQVSFVVPCESFPSSHPGVSR